MCSETSDERAALLDRAIAVRDALRRSSAAMPDRVLGYVSGIAAELKSPRPDASRLSEGAHGILQWYMDQGFKEVDLHAELAALARDVLNCAQR